jgi:arylsulfatase A-like enzyme
MRIPLIVRYPALTEADGLEIGGSISEALVTNIDLAPTLLELAGIKPPASMEGQSWAAALVDPGFSGREAFRYEYFLDFPFPVPEIRAVRTPRYKLIDYASRRPDEFFDLRLDPDETRNLLESPDAIPAGVLEELRAQIEDPS